MGAKSEHPFGGWFGVVGFFIGLFVGLDSGAGFWGACIVGLICAGIGLFLEHLVAKLLIFATLILWLLVRREILQAFFRGLSE